MASTVTRNTFKPEGVFTALVTPFIGSGQDSVVDYEALRKEVNRQIELGIDGLVPMGTTGESPTVSHDEHEQIIRETIKAAAGRVPIIAGTGSNSTKEAIRLTKSAKNDGANAALIVNPYYNRPTQEGLFQHFKAIADAVPDMPIVLYNIPGRCGVKMNPDTVARLYNACGSIVAVKEATGSLDNASATAAACPIIVLSGDDSLVLPLLSIGGRGVISVLSNMDPRFMKAIVDPVLKENDYAKARAAHFKYLPVIKSLFAVGSNPEPVKEAMGFMGLLKDVSVRQPLTNLGAEAKEKLRTILKENGVIA